MTLPWSGQQVEWLEAMGLQVLRRPASNRAAQRDDTAGDLPAGLLRAARGVDLGPLVATVGVPRDVASRRAFWRVLRAQRKAMRRG
jgi:hypothetical protein